MDIKGDLKLIIRKIVKNYHYKNEKAEKFFKIIIPEILLLKFLKLTHPNNYKEINIDITYISNIYKIINIPFLELFYFNNHIRIKILA